MPLSNFLLSPSITRSSAHSRYRDYSHGKFYELLAPGGQLIIVDFDKNEQISHPKVHNGFTQEELNDRLKKTGFVSTASHTFHRGEKAIHE